MKSLIESIFDKDLAQQGVCIGDMYELDEWGYADTRHDTFEEYLEQVYRYENIQNVLKRPQWKKISKIIESKFNTNILKANPVYDNPRQYQYSYLFYCLTYIILYCSDLKEIEQLAEDFLKECLSDRLNDIDKTDEYKKDEYKSEIEVKALKGLHEDLIRMVVFSFKIGDDGHKYVVYMTLKKKD